MSPKFTGIFSSLRNVWQDVNPLAPGVSFSTQDFLEDRIYELEQEIKGLKRELSDTKAQRPAGLTLTTEDCWQVEFGA
jgi:hypothetical protein